MLAGWGAGAAGGLRGVLTDCDCAASCEAAAEEALEEGEGLLLCHGGRGGDTVEMRRAYST